jgi:uracil-DNA glycosylase family 4
MCVAEASGEHEAREGRPLVEYAPAGSLFERTLRRMGIDRAQLSVSNLLRCRPKNNWLAGSPWEYAALRACRPNLLATIADRAPRAIFAMGDLPLRELTGEAGEARGISHMRGYVLPSTLEGRRQTVPCECAREGRSIRSASSATERARWTMEYQPTPRRSLSSPASTRPSSAAGRQPTRAYSPATSSAR